MFVIKARQVQFSSGFSYVDMSWLVNSSLQERIETISAALQGHMDDEEAEEEPFLRIPTSIGVRPFPLNMALTFLKSWQ